ncbi:MAG TPA: nickel pincer cofactor biosynthesis protein LarC [Actinotalea sp.]
MSTDTPALRPAWIDGSAGVAGDMLLGALVDAGAPLAALQSAVDAVIPGTVRLVVRTVKRAGMRATKVDVELLAEDLPHRHWTEIRTMLERAELAGPTRTRALAVFAALARAEGRAHGIDAAEVHFHEVGAWDSIADVVGVCAALTELGVGRLSAGPVALGSGHITAAHGAVPVPVPAVLELATGWSVTAGGAGELATPTGMALVVTLAEACEDLPPIEVGAVGVGAGTRDVEGRANVVRVVLGAVAGPRAAATSSAPAGSVEAMVLLDTNVDDLDPRLWPQVLVSLLEDGAADAWLTPILMKKGRPAHVLSVLAPAAGAAALEQRILALVPTLGVRRTVVTRASLDRTWRTVDVAGAQVRIKLGWADGIITSATPEFEDVAEAARAQGRPQRAVLADAVAAAVAAGLSPGATG